MIPILGVFVGGKREMRGKICIVYLIMLLISPIAFVGNSSVSGYSHQTPMYYHTIKVATSNSSELFGGSWGLMNKHI
jgi:hypothetical protein